MSNTSVYVPIIGLEIHVELKTVSKMFCRCPANWFGKPPNTHVCPVCLGMPGALPVPNRQAVEWTIKIGQALNCRIARSSKFDRKHYFYPDLPKGYQISQYDQPIAENGHLELVKETQGEPSRFGIRRVHLEEDTGKLMHEGTISRIDFNRSGVPLVEIVTEPHFRSSDDVKMFLEELHSIIRYLDVSDADMEKGSMRLEPNISVAVVNQPAVEPVPLPEYKVEVKNINSFMYVKKAIEYEIERHSRLLQEGKIPAQETRGYNEKKGITVEQRTKEEAHDYRYFPEPDIPLMTFPVHEIETIAAAIPELPLQKLKRYQSSLGLKYRDAFILSRSAGLASRYERLLDLVAEKKNEPVPDIALPVAALVVNKKVTLDMPDEQLAETIVGALTPKTMDDTLIQEIITQVLHENTAVVEQYRQGKLSVVMFLVGQVMKATKSQANAQQVKTQLEKALVTTVE